MRFAFVAKHRGIWPVSWICEALGVSRSGFHAWLVRAPSARSRSDADLAAKVRASFISGYRTYGARRVWHDLLAEGLSCGIHRVERLMRLHALKARPRRRGLPKDEGQRSVIAGDVLDRQFNADAPNRKWVADFTYIWTAEGWIYVAAVIDLFSRRVVGWSGGDRLHRRLAIAALQTALTMRPPPEGLIHHSDRGSQYCSVDYQATLRRHGIRISMSGKGNCYDNAMVETFFKTLKSELVWRTTFFTRADAERDIARYIDGSYNPVRRHSALDYLSPAQFEKQAVS